MTVIHEQRNQPTWVDLALPDLRNVCQKLLAGAPLTISAANNIKAAIEVLLEHLGFRHSDASTTCVKTPLGDVLVHRQNLFHIVEKRAEARERYVLFALDTMQRPFEVWNVAYTDGTHRLAYIGLYRGKRQMLVVVHTIEGRLLWNFMHSDAKSLNKHRHGKLIYQRNP